MYIAHVYIAVQMVSGIATRNSQMQKFVLGLLKLAQ